MTKTFFMVTRSFSQAKEARMHFHSSQRSTILPVELPCDNAGPICDGVRQCVLCVVGQWREQNITAKHYLSFHATERSITFFFCPFLYGYATERKAIREKNRLPDSSLRDGSVLHIPLRDIFRPFRSCLENGRPI